MKRSYMIIGLVGIIFMLLIWGIIGSSKAGAIGVSCDFGLGKDGNILCWRWHQNIIGDIGEIITTNLNT